MVKGLVNKKTIINSKRNITDTVVPSADPEKQQGVQNSHPLKNYKALGFLSNICPDPLKVHKTNHASIQCWAIIGLPAKLQLNEISLAGQKSPAFSGIPLSPTST